VVVVRISSELPIGRTTATSSTWDVRRCSLDAPLLHVYTHRADALISKSPCLAELDTKIEATHSPVGFRYD
jgi:hypothetical protein